MPASLPRRVAILGPTFPWRGGIAFYTSRLAAALDRAGVEVYSIGFARQYPALLFPGAGDRERSAALPAVPGLEPILDSLDPRTWRRAGARIREIDPDWIVMPWWTWFWTLPFLAVLREARRARRIPLLALCHNVVDHEASRMKAAASRAVLARADRIFVHARSESRRLEALLGRPADAVGFLPLYDLDLGPGEISRAPARAALGIAADRVVALYFGIVRPYKGVDVLLDAVERLPPRLPLTVLLVGEVWGSRGHRQLRRRVATLGERVRLVDRYVSYDEVPAYFRAADFAVTPYRGGSQSGVVPMAFAFDLPVVASAVGGLADVVDEGETGLLVPPGDAGALAAALERLCDGHLRAQLSSCVTVRKARLSWERYVELLPFAPPPP